MAIITKLFSKRLLISTCIIFLIFGVSFGQSENKVLNDSIVDEIKSIKAADITVESGEQIKRLQKLAENTVTKEEIESFKMQNDSLINLLDSLIVVDNIVNLKDQTTRYLSNRITFWQKFSNYYQSFNSDITDEVKLIDNSKKRLEKDIVRWKKTNTQIKSQDVNSGLIPRLERVLGILDSTKRDLNEKSDNLLVILNQATQGNFQIQSHLKSIDDVLSENNKQIFVQNEPSLFSSEYWNKTKTNFLEPIQTFYNTEVLDGIGFFSDRLLEVSIQILLIIVLFIIFNAISKNLRRVDYESHSTYRKFLVKIIARSFSASIVIIVFFSSVFFSNRPEVIKDLQIIIISIPIVLIAKTFVNSKFYFYLNIFWILILFNVVYVIFPPDNIYYMIILMLSALLELFVLWKLFWYFYKIKGLISFINILSVTIIIINFGFAVFGVFGLLFGSTTMAELALNMPVFTAYSGLLIFSSMIILNGLISFFLETKYAKNLNVIAVFGDII
ncbi:MAG: hypothetical protein C0598_05715, partial [Marinilabiliales bacterium]